VAAYAGVAQELSNITPNWLNPSEIRQKFGARLFFLLSLKTL
jgi:hypothetical protein